MQGLFAISVISACSCTDPYSPFCFYGTKYRQDCHFVVVVLKRSGIMSSPPLTRLFVNDIEVYVPPNTTVLEAAEKVGVQVSLVFSLHPPPTMF